MLPHQQRVVDEKTALDDKIAKLREFLKGPVFQSLAPEEQSRLARQLKHMEDYSQVLGERIQAFS